MQKLYLERQDPDHYDADGDDEDADANKAMS